MSALLLSVLLVTACGHGLTYSEGERAGYVVKFSNKGFLCKSWEGTMNLAGDGQASMVQFDFTVDADKSELIKTLQEAVTNGKRVKVKYEQGKLTGSCTTDSGYFLQSAEYTQQ